MPEAKQITVEEAAKILGVSPRSVRRYAKKGKLVHSYVQGKFGEELRFSEEIVKAFANTLSKASVNGSQRPLDNPGDSSMPLDARIIWEAYQALQTEYRNAAAQIGFLKAKTEEIPRLTERAESLIKEKDTLEKQKTELEGELGSYKEKLKWQPWLTLVLVVLALLVGFAVSPSMVERISALLTGQ